MHHLILTFLLLLTALMASLPQPSLAQSNLSQLTQINPGTGLGNQLHLDQSAASYTSLQGQFRRLDTGLVVQGVPALQYGSNNQAHVVLGGFGARALLNQHGSLDFGLAPPGTNNIAQISALGLFQTATVDQRGNGNRAILELDDHRLASGDILQDGDHHVGEVSVLAPGGQGSLRQIGQDTQAQVVIDPSSQGGTQLNYTIVGQSVSTAAPVTVRSNAASGAAISIVQWQ